MQNGDRDHRCLFAGRVTLAQGQFPSCNPPWARGRTPPRGCSAQGGGLRLGKPLQTWR